MTPDLVLGLGDPHYSSWSMRAGLIVLHWDLPVEFQFCRMYTDDFPALLAAFPPARSVPVLRLSSGQVVRDSLAIAEELASRFSETPLWPTAPDARAEARSLAAEIHSGFAALRSACPMNLRDAYRHPDGDAALDQDLARLDQIWSQALDRSGGPWLCGDYSIADCFYAPVAMRVLGYHLPVSEHARAYCLQHVSEPGFQKWAHLGRDWERQPIYDKDWPRADWPTG